MLFLFTACGSNGGKVDQGNVDLGPDAITPSQENYIRVLDWIVANGTEVIEEDDVNEYGNVKGYSYTYIGPKGWLELYFEVDSDGTYDAYTELEITRSEFPGTGTDLCIDQHLWLDSVSFEYLWRYEVFVKITRVEAFHGWIKETDLSKVSQTTSDYKITNYEESSSFKSVSGISDVRSVIIDDLFETLGIFEEFLKMYVKMEMADIGFISYSE